MRTLPLLFVLTACGVDASQDAPEASATSTERRTLEEVYARTAYLYGEIQRLQAELSQLDKDLGGLSSQVDGHVTVLKAAATDIGEGSCAIARDAASGLATGRRTHKPIRFHTTTHVWGDPHVELSGISPLGNGLVSVDEDADGTADYVALELDLDGDGFSDLIELGGDVDDDGDMLDDALEVDLKLHENTNQLCGATDHF